MEGCQEFHIADTLYSNHSLIYIGLYDTEIFTISVMYPYGIPYFLHCGKKRDESRRSLVCWLGQCRCWPF